VTEIVPRAEFRTFGEGLVELVSAHLDATATSPVERREMPPELYLVSLRTDEAVVKVRAGLLDVKIKTGETPEGYEIFEPRAKLEFPVTHEALGRALDDLDVSVDLQGDTFTAEDLTELAAREGALIAVRVEKIRYGFMAGDVICEYARVRFDGLETETAACESADHAAIAPVVQALGLSGREILSYPKAAKRFAGAARPGGHAAQG
jgi:hypothetical protein